MRTRVVFPGEGEHPAYTKEFPLDETPDDDGMAHILRRLSTLDKSQNKKYFNRLANEPKSK